MHMIQRHRLLAEILHADKPVVTIVAPAGFGKSTLMRQIFDALTARDLPKALLTLTDRDNDFGHLFTQLWGALVTVSCLKDVMEPSPDDGGLGSSQLGYSRLQRVASTLADAIGVSSAPFTLLIDEFEKLQSHEGIQLIKDIALSLSPGQHMIIGARTMRQLPLTALDLQDRVLRITVEQLRFDFHEAKAFMKMHDLVNFSDDQMALLFKRTEGWPAGLRLATLALHGQKLHPHWLENFSGRSDELAAYLAEHVLAQLPDESCRFLLQTSILDQLTGELCDEVLERTDSAEMIDEIYRANLFLAPIEPGSEWFRFHALFREFLFTELKRTSPSIIPMLHRRAAAWHSRARNHSQAVGHALLVGDHGLAADLMETCAMEFIQTSQLETVAKWTDQISFDEISVRPSLLRARAYAMIALHRFNDARNALSTIRQTAQDLGREVEPEVDVQFALLCEWSSQHEQSRAVIAKVAGRVEPSDGVVYGTSQNIQAYLKTLSGEFDEARQMLGRAKSAYHKMQYGLWTFTFTLCFEGVLELIQGNLQDALERCETAFRNATGAGLAVACAYLTEALYERNEVARAGALATEYLHLVRDNGHPDAIILVYRTAANAAFLDGRGAQAEALLTELSDIGDMREIPRIKASAWIAKCRLALLADRTDAAERFLKLASKPEIWEPFRSFHLFPQEINDPQISEIRLKLLTGNGYSIIPEVELAVRAAHDSGRKWRKLRLQVLLAQIYATNQRRGRAIRILEDALIAASKDRLIRVFADEPWFLPDLLEEITRRNQRINHNYLEQVVMATAAMGYRADEVVHKAATAEMLTPKETEIMRLVAKGQSNKEIARTLYITENTVETHLRRINLKIDTRSRTQAVAKLRENGVID